VRKIEQLNGEMDKVKKQLDEYIMRSAMIESALN
jgi:hypothetical protein